MSGPINEIFSGDDGDHYGSAYFKYEHDLMSLKFFDFFTIFGIKTAKCAKNDLTGAFLYDVHTQGADISGQNTKHMCIVKI